MMGCTNEQSLCLDNEPLHRVFLDGFYIGMLEINQSQWEKVMGSSIAQQMMKAETNSSCGIGSEYPMYYVNWDEAMKFCRLLSNKTGKSYTLPTEAQWEYVARGGKKADGTKYAGGNIIDNFAWYVNNSDYTSHPCGRKRANVLGVYDMLGNVWEWCLDWYAPYDDLFTNNPVGPWDGSERVIRGGSWGDEGQSCQTALRLGWNPDERQGFLGFRVVCIP